MKKLFFGFLLLVAQNCATTPQGTPGRNTACDSVVRDTRLARVKHANTLNEVTERNNARKEPSDALDSQLQTEYRDWMNKLTISGNCLNQHNLSESSIPTKKDEIMPKLIDDTTPAAPEDDKTKDDKTEE